jgi:hypothetical protein
MPFTIPNVRCTGQTDKAICVDAYEVEQGPIWIPKSQVHDDSEVWKPDQDGDLVVSDWYAEKKGWAR